MKYYIFDLHFFQYLQYIIRLNDWEIKEANKATTSNENKKLPYSRHEVRMIIKLNEYSNE